jgi:hypothetical protein
MQKVLPNRQRPQYGRRSLLDRVLLMRLVAGYTTSGAHHWAVPLAPTKRLAEGNTFRQIGAAAWLGLANAKSRGFPG